MAPSSLQLSVTLRALAPTKDLPSQALAPPKPTVSSLQIPGQRQLHVSARLGTSPAETSVDRLSPFTERASTKRRLGGLKGDGRTSTLQIDPLLRSLDTLSTTTLRDSISPADIFSPGLSPDAFNTQTTDGRDPATSSSKGEAGAEEDKDAVNDISLRLPELRELLGFLREARRGQASGDERKLGRVFLVGTGPGDAELLTVKAWRLLQTADLVLYDRLVSRDVLDLVHPEARLLYVGKSAGFHSRTQEEIHELLLSFAEAGATVVRLKGGDPLVFGRGGEEVEYLQQHGIHVDIVPGITSASGIGASLGIPLTHRGLANSVRFLTGHSRKGGDDPLHVAASAADPDSTLVIYMGLATLRGLVEKLLANGLPADTPAVAVERGTTQWQRNVFANLSELPDEVAAASLASPTLVIVGLVVALSPLWPSRRGDFLESSGALGGSPRQTRQLAGGVSEPRDRRLRGADPALPSERL